MLAVVSKVPDVGNVTLVFAVSVPVNVNAPENVTLPPIVMSEEPLLTPVPPRVPDSVPVQPRVKEAALTSAVEGDPPKVRVTFVSSVLVSAAPVGICAVVAKVPEVGKVTDVDPVSVPVKGNAPEKVTFPPMVIRDEPLLTPVPPLVPESVPVHPNVKEVAAKRATVGEPPKVSVTLVSSTRVNADGVGS